MNVDVESQARLQLQTHTTQPSPTHQEMVSDTDLPVQSIQVSFDSWGNLEYPRKTWWDNVLDSYAPSRAQVYVLPPKSLHEASV